MSKIGRFCHPILIPYFVLLTALVACDSSERDASFIGYVEAELLYVAAPQSGWLISHNLEAGSQLSTGDLLFQLDSEQQQVLVQEASYRLQQAEAQERDASEGARSEELSAIEAQLMEARAVLDYAESEQLRWAKLVEQGLAPESRGTQVKADYDASLARFNTIAANLEVAKLGARKEFINSTDAARRAAQAVLSQAQWQLSQRTVTAHSSAQVEEVFFRKGEYVNAGSVVLALMPEQALKVRFFVPQSRLAQFKNGENVAVSADGASGVNGAVQAKIFHIARNAEFTPPVIYDKNSRQKLVFLVEARLPVDTELAPGLPVDVELP